MRCCSLFCRRELVSLIAFICIAYRFPVFALTMMHAVKLHFGREAGCALAAFACLLLSAVVCRHHFPEKQFPGKFDNFTSHAIMHVLVLCDYFVDWLFLCHLAART